MDSKSQADLNAKIVNFRQERNLGACDNFNVINPSFFNNIHEGKRCFILGTAYTIDNIDLNKLKGEITFGLNSIVNAYIPNYWVACSGGGFIPSSNIKLIYQSGIVFMNQACLKIATKYAKENDMKLNLDKTVFYFMDHLVTEINYGVLKNFSSDIITLQGGGSVLFPAIQIAYAMGCNPIYLVGVSLKKRDPALPHYYSSSLKKAQLTGFNCPANIAAMSAIKAIADTEGREIIAATPNNLLVDKKCVKEISYNTLFK